MSQSGGGQPPGPGAPQFGGTQLMPMMDSAPSDMAQVAPGYGMPPPQNPPLASLPQTAMPQALGLDPAQQAQYGQPQYAQPQQPQYGQPQYGQPQYGQPLQQHYASQGQYGQPAPPQLDGQYGPPIIASPQAAQQPLLPPGYAGGPQLQQAMPQQHAPRPSHNEEVPEQGFWVERLKGLKMLGAGAALLALNVGSLIFLEQYYIITTVVMLPLFFGGGWQVVFGDEFDDRTHELVLWKRLGFYGSIGFGLLCGVGLLVLLNL